MKFRIWSLRVLAVVGAFLFAAAARGADGETLLTPGEDVPVVFWGREIFIYRVNIGTLSTAERAKHTLQRLESVGERGMFERARSEPIELSGLNGHMISIGEHFVLMVSEADLDPETGESLEEARDRVLVALEELRQAQIEQRNVPLILRGVGLSLVVTLVLLLVVYGLRRLRFWLGGVAERRAERARKLRVRNFDLRPQFVMLVHRMLVVAVWLLAFLSVYIWLASVLGFYPYTAPWGDALGEKVSDVVIAMLHGLLGAIPSLLAVLLIFLLTRGASRLVDQMFRTFAASRGNTDLISADTARASRRVAVTLIWVFGVVLAYPYIPGSNSQAFKGVGVMLGLMISLGSTGVVNQVMSGFVVLYSGAVRTGEYVEFDEVEGTVTEIGLLSTRVLTPDGEYVTVPNAVLVGHTTINHSRLAKRKGSVVTTAVTIGYDVPWRQIHALLLGAATKVDGIHADPAPVVLQPALGDFYVNYVLRFRIKRPASRRAVLSALHAEILDAFHKAGVQIMSPHFEGQPELPVVPPGDPPEPADA